MSEDKVDPKDRRKYQRVQLADSPQSLAISIEGYGESAVFDMSYSGAAFAQPKEKTVEAGGEPIKVHLITEIDKTMIEAHVVRSTPKFIACEFIDVPSSARVIIDRLVSDRMVGLNMQLIDRGHYSPHADFNYWFHGPKETNLFLWAKGDVLEKAQFDIQSMSLVFEDDNFFYEKKDPDNKQVPRMNNQQVLQKALAIISQMRSNVKPLLEFKKIIEEQVG